jgi:hypothetical protein
LCEIGTTAGGTQGENANTDDPNRSGHLVSIEEKANPVSRSNALVQLQARYHHCGEAASKKCLSAATFVRPPWG